MTWLATAVVLTASAWWFAWTDLFHVTVGVPTVAIAALGALLATRRYRSVLREDPDAILDDTGLGVPGKLLRGVLAGAALVVALHFVFGAVARTPLHPLLVDTATERLVAELDVLEQLGQWPAIAQRLASLPRTRTSTARARLAGRKADALIKVAEGTADLAAACDIYRTAEQITRDEGLDARLVRAKLEWCDARTRRRPMPANARADIARVERLGPEALRLEVRVVDETGRSLAGLLAEDFAVTADGQQLKVAAVSTLASSTAPGYRVSVVVDQSTERRGDSVLTAAYLVTGLGPADSVEVVACGPSAHVPVARSNDPFVVLTGLLHLSAATKCTTADAVWLALDRLGNGLRRAVILVVGGPATGLARSMSELTERVSTAGVPVFVVALGPADERLWQLAKVSGGDVVEPNRRDQRESLRARLRSLQGPSPLTYVLVSTGATASRGRLDLRVGGANAATATTGF